MEKLRENDWDVLSLQSRLSEINRGGEPLPCEQFISGIRHIIRQNSDIEKRLGIPLDPKTSEALLLIEQRAEEVLFKLQHPNEVTRVSRPV